MLSGSTLFWVNQDANAQITEQTDRSEDDWRKSKKKRGSSDIFEGITNTRKDGQGWGSGPVDPIDSLPAESRRHLMKERAKAIAMSDPGQPVTAPYKPSDDAASDPGLAAQEKEAWDDLLEDMNDSMGQGQSDQSGQNGTGDSSQQQNDQQSSGQQSSNQSGQSSSEDMAQGGGSSSTVKGNQPKFRQAKVRQSRARLRNKEHHNLLGKVLLMRLRKADKQANLEVKGNKGRHLMPAKFPLLQTRHQRLNP